MLIPETAGYLHMPVVRNVPMNLYDEKSWFKKFKAWRTTIPNEMLLEDNYQILPKKCNDLLGLPRHIQVCCFIPKGFLFNGASIPRQLSSLYLPHGILYLGAFHHDFLYSYGGLIVFTEEMQEMVFVQCNQKQSDTIFYHINEEVNHFKTATYPAYLALRMFGFITWNHCRKKVGEFAADFPDLLPIYEKGIGKLNRSFG